MTFPNPAMPAASRQPEFYLQVLWAVCRANWLALLLVTCLVLAFRFAPGYYWPQTGPMNTLYTFVAVEFALFNLALWGLLRYRGWYQATPRKKVNKLQHLTWAVLAWDAVHVIGAFELFGGFRGPFVVLLPLLVLGAFLILPRRAALLSTAAMVLALLGLAGLQYQGWLYPYGALGINFTLLPQSLPLNVGVIVVALLVGVKLGDYLGGRQRLEPWGLAVSALYDPRFGCFSRETLAHRCADEVERARRYGQPPALALLALEGLDTLVAERGPDAADAALEALWQQISLHTRHDLDTCAYLGDGVFGLLLPTADTRQAQQVADRVSDRMHQFAPEIAGHLVTNVVAVPTQIGEGTMTALRARALRAVESAEAPA